MNIILQELHKILDSLKEYGYEFVYVGNTAYLKLPNVKIRAEIINTDCYNNYDAISLKAMRNDSGKIDEKWVKFVDIWGMLPTDIPNDNFPNGVVPHIWRGCGEISWYGATPKARHYKMFSDVVLNYIKIFE